MTNATVAILYHDLLRLNFFKPSITASRTLSSSHRRTHKDLGILATLVALESAVTFTTIEIYCIVVSKYMGGSKEREG